MAGCFQSAFLFSLPDAFCPGSARSYSVGFQPREKRANAPRPEGTRRILRPLPPSLRVRCVCGFSLLGPKPQFLSLHSFASCSCGACPALNSFYGLKSGNKCPGGKICLSMKQKLPLKDSSWAHPDYSTYWNSKVNRHVGRLVHELPFVMIEHSDNGNLDEGTTNEIRANLSRAIPVELHVR